MNNSNIKEDLLEKTKPIDSKKPEDRDNMGLGVLGHHKTNFVRKFRWTLMGNGLCENFVKKVSFDFVNQTIHMQVMEVAYSGATDIDVQRWLDLDLAKETLIFTTFDGCGNAIYEYEFRDFELLENKTDFDYYCSNESVREVAVKYDRCSRRFLATTSPKNSTPVKKKSYWKVQLEGRGPEYDVKVINRVNLDIDETEINFLNCKMFIPGKVEWQNLVLSLQKQYDMEFLTSLISGNKPTIHLHLYLHDNKTKLETWIMKSCRLGNMKHEEDKYELTISYNEASYINCTTPEEKNK
jgi:hypothetical protein